MAQVIKVTHNPFYCLMGKRGHSLAVLPKRPVMNSGQASPIPNCQLRRVPFERDMSKTKKIIEMTLNLKIVQKEIQRKGYKALKGAVAGS